MLMSCGFPGTLTPPAGIMACQPLSLCSCSDLKVVEVGLQSVSHNQCFLVVEGVNLRQLVKKSMAFRKYQFPILLSGSLR